MSSSHRSGSIGVRVVAIAALAVAAVLTAPLQAHGARLVVTGHDADHHCMRDAEANRAPSCAWAASAIRWVRSTAPDPTKPVLILDRSALDLVGTVNKMGIDAAAVPYDVVSPRSARFTSVPLTTAQYSAILIASSKDDPDDPTKQDLNETGSTPDTDAINRRAADIRAFFDAGGGIFVASGGQAARSNSLKYYGFLGITQGGAAVSRPFRLTAVGRQIGWQDAHEVPSEQNQINCCETHVSFELPAPETALKAAELDTVGRAVTLVADAKQLKDIEEAPAPPATVFGAIPGSDGATVEGSETRTSGPTGTAKPACVPKRSLKISLRRPKGVRFAKIVVYVNGKKVRTVPGKRLGVGKKTKPFSIKLRQDRTSKVRIVATTASGRRLTFRRTYKPC